MLIHHQESFLELIISTVITRHQDLTQPIVISPFLPSPSPNTLRTMILRSGLLCLQIFWKAIILWDKPRSIHDLIGLRDSLAPSLILAMFTNVKFKRKCHFCSQISPNPVQKCHVCSQISPHPVHKCHFRSQMLPHPVHKCHPTPFTNVTSFFYELPHGFDKSEICAFFHFLRKVLFSLVWNEAPEGRRLAMQSRIIIKGIDPWSTVTQFCISRISQDLDENLKTASITTGYGLS